MHSCITFSPLLLLAYFTSTNADSSKRSAKDVRQYTLFHEINAICVLNNAVRLSPGDYLKKYGDAKCASSCARTAANGGKKAQLLFLNADLCQASKFHANEMSKYNQLSHETLAPVPDRSFSTRIKRFFKESSSLAENIARGHTYTEPIKLMNAWIASPGHCKNVMNDKYNAIGVGFSRKHDFYSAQSFSGIKTRPMNFKIACGSHIVRKGQPLFFLVAVNRADGPVKVVVNGRPFQMTRDLGAATQGVFRLDGNRCGITPASGCAKYHFEVGSQRYPKGFELETQGFGACKERIDTPANQ